MSSIQAGMFVRCQDDDNVERYVQKNRTYQVVKTSQRGALVNLRGVAITLASARFTPVSQSSGGASEMASASNQ